MGMLWIIENRPKFGRARKLTASDEERLLALFHENPTLTNEEAARAMGIGKSTVSDYLKRAKFQRPPAAGTNRDNRLHYSEEYRLEAVLATQCSSSLNEVADKYKIPSRTLYEWRKRWNETQSLKSKKGPGRPPNLTEEERTQLMGLFHHNPTMTNEEAARTMGNKIKSSSVSNYIYRNVV